MRRLVACPECKRRFDVTKAKAGTKFRCVCGQRLKIAKPRGHDAAVVRCSGCGAPRRAGAAACEHCGSDFTLHEQDLHTICPACLTRVSDRARYCHCCAALLTSDAVVTEKTKLACPACQPACRLSSRRLPSYPLAVLECPGCAGLWMSVTELDQLFEQESRGMRLPVVRADSRAQVTASSGYRPCVVCGDLMSRRNFGRGKSGVILDVCGQHGIWFDTDELSRLVAWTRAGQLDEARLDLARLVGSPDQTRKKVALARASSQGSSAGGSLPSSSTDTSADDDSITWVWVAAEIAGTLVRLL